MGASSTFAVVAGGGTAGHVLPALAVAEGLVAGGHEPDEIHYVGAQRGLETTLLPDSPFPATFFDVIGLQRQLTRDNLGFVPKMTKATMAARRLLRRLRPRVVVSVGGYASMPPVFAARSLGIPIVVVSWDRRPGAASRLTARFAAASAVAFDDSELPKAVVTGAPVRRAVLDVDRVAGRHAAREALGIVDDRFLVVVTGGSLGSGLLNETIARYVATRADDGSLAVRHVVGDRFLQGIGPPRDGSHGVRYDVVGFDPDLPTTYTAADLVIGRGGAGTVAEIAVAGVPSILVPWAGAAEDHQTSNVRWLADADAAVMITEENIQSLASIIDELRADPNRLASLADRARRRGELNRSGALPALIERVALL